MKHPYSRREFLKIAFTTVSSVAVANPIFGELLPESEPRAIAPAYKIAIDESGYLYDPDFDFVLPTWREMLEQELNLSSLSEKKAQEALLQWQGYDAEETEYLPDLDEEVDPQWCIRQWFRDHSEWTIGFDLYDSLDEEAAERLGLVVIDGEHPGSDFLAVKARDAEELQERLWREGINVEIV